MRRMFHGLAAALLLATLPLAANAAVFVSVSFGPPLLPVYVPPPIPGPGYIWVPGYWAWNGYDYYWVPGTWVLPPAVGMLWTPGYWGWSGGAYLWHAGYWGPHVGFYGGIDYGCGYDGVGYHGGYWRGSTFVINRTVINEGPVHRVAYNGGAGGVVARPTPAELRVAHEHHLGMSQMQVHNQQAAEHERSLRASFNHGQPAVAATERPGDFHGPGVVAARGGGAPPAAARHGNAPAPHANNRELHLARAEGEAQRGSSPAGHASAHESASHMTSHAQTSRSMGHEPPARPLAHEQSVHGIPHEQSAHAMPREHASHPMAPHETHAVAHETHAPTQHPTTRQPPEEHGSAVSERGAVRRSHEGGGHESDNHTVHAAGSHGAPEGARPQSHLSQRPERPAEHGHPG
jgi:WXXGXW repeat (2 copies)